MPKLHLVIAHGPDEEKLELALRYGISYAHELSTQLTILVPTIGNAPSTILRHVIGEQVVTELAKGKVIQKNGISILMRSIRTVNEWEEDGVVVALWGGKNMLAKVEQCIQAKVVIVLSRETDDVTQWQEKHQPNIIE